MANNSQSVGIPATKLIEQLQKAVAENGTELTVLITLAEYYEGWSGYASELQVREAHEFEEAATPKVIVFQ